jgi:hypothetical protein
LYLSERFYQLLNARLAPSDSRQADNAPGADPKCHSNSFGQAVVAPAWRISAACLCLSVSISGFVALLLFVPRHSAAGRELGRCCNSLHHKSKNFYSLIVT